MDELTEPGAFRLAPTGLPFENGHFLARIVMESTVRETRNRELQIAREVQRRLFPQERPPVAGLEYAGFCRPAFEVGGDYYDFIPVSERTLGIAIGDVSGKGVPASLLMATLRAYLHGRTAGHAEALPALFSNLNRFVHDSTPANRYATFFYAQHDVSTRTLRYVNGGHNAPLLFRAAAGDEGVGPIRLTAGGAAVGFFPECRYFEEQVALGPGDLLVAFTDGVSEAINGPGEEWGEARLIHAIREARTEPAAAVIDRIMAAVDTFVGDAHPHDDMTLVVLRAV